MLKNITKLAEHTRTHLTVLASSVVLCCSLIDTAQAIPFSSIEQVYFFGDSLTDSGFNNAFSVAHIPPASPPGKAPTFTTFGGYTYAQYLARDIKGYVLIPRGEYYPPGAPYPPFPTPPYDDTITNNLTPLNGTGPVIPILEGIDYAAGGSTTNSTGNNYTWAPSLNQQLDYFLGNYPEERLNPNALYFVWSGANDILEVLQLAFSPTPPSADELQFLFFQAANTAANNVANAVARLSERGAKRVVVISLPNIGYTPLVDQAAAVVPTLPASMKTVTFTFNSMLNQALGTVIKRTHVKVLYFDAYDLLDNVILASKAGKPYVIGGESFLFGSYSAPACGYYEPATCPGGSTPPCPTYVQAISCANTDAYPNGPTPTGSYYLFADELHPTDAGHRLLSLALEDAIRSWK